MIFNLPKNHGINSDVRPETMNILLRPMQL